ncbi:MAG: TlpA disulfide reductase family protein [Candidatus Nanopelagicales bacterium]|nr:TlpA family protein disulfide reductase [Candidatus Nanopelagicales bacterium]
MTTGRRLVWLATAVVAGVLVAGCGAEDGSAPAGTPLPTNPTTTASAAPTASVTDDVTKADVDAADLKPCPTSDATIPAVPNGLPDVTLDCLGRGPEVRLAGLRGKPMVVNVWASWCAPCRKELPVFGEVSRATGDSVQFLGIDLADDRLSALRFASASKMGFPSVQDPNSTVRAGLRLVGVPTTLLVRPDGTIAGRIGIVADAQALRDAIDRYLNVRVP